MITGFVIEPIPQTELDQAIQRVQTALGDNALTAAPTLSENEAIAFALQYLADQDFKLDPVL